MEIKPIDEVIEDPDNKPEDVPEVVDEDVKYEQSDVFVEEESPQSSEMVVAKSRIEASKINITAML